VVGEPYLRSHPLHVPVGHPVTPNILLYTGAESVSFGPELHVAPLSALPGRLNRVNGTKHYFLKNRTLHSLMNEQ